MSIYISYLSTAAKYPRSASLISHLMAIIWRRKGRSLASDICFTQTHLDPSSAAEVSEDPEPINFEESSWKMHVSLTNSPVGKGRVTGIFFRHHQTWVQDRRWWRVKRESETAWDPLNDSCFEKQEKTTILGGYTPSIDAIHRLHVKIRFTCKLNVDRCYSWVICLHLASSHWTDVHLLIKNPVKQSKQRRPGLPHRLWWQTPSMTDLSAWKVFWMQKRTTKSVTSFLVPVGKFIIPSATRGKQFKGTSRRFDGFRFYINQAVIKTIYKVVKMFFSIEATLKYKNVWCMFQLSWTQGGHWTYNVRGATFGKNLGVF